MNKVGYALSNQLFNFIGRLLTPDWDRKLLGLSQLPIRSILDIGANEGQFCKTMRKIFPQSTIYAFEPLPDPFNRLETWTKTQKGRAIAFNVALGDEVKTLEMKQHLYFHASSSMLNTTALCEKMYPMVRKQSAIAVQQSTLDRAIAHLLQPLAPDILIKLDVQGYEDRVIQGGIKVFQKARACIVEISLDKLYDQQTEFKDIFLLLNDLGYRYAGNLDQIRAKNGRVIYLNAVFLKDPSS
jgi:FkbM family methyltransferase